MADFIQIGVTAMRDPATGGFLPAIPLFIESNSATAEAQQKLIADLGKLFAARMRMEAAEAAQ